jgi:nicotinamidase/pyrazinamidase
MITLVIVDCQSDFIAGTMSKKNTKNILPEIKNFIKEHQKDIDQIIFTVDWHPYNHCSFKKNGGLWPQHCVQDTPGACIEPKLLKYVQSTGIKYSVDRKGVYEEVEEYGAFSEIDVVQDSLGDRYYFDNLIRVDANTEIVICGVTGDYSIKETLKNLKENRIEPKVFMDGLASMDNGEKLNKFIKEWGIEKYEENR